LGRRFRERRVGGQEFSIEDLASLGGRRRPQKGSTYRRKRKRDV